jgi:hypothetical protein
MRSTVKFDISPISARLRAVGLLAVLIAHIAFMASPLHAQIASRPSHVSNVASIVARAATATTDGVMSGDHHSEHCIIEWLKLDQTVSVAALLAVGLTAALLLPDLWAPGMRPIARAHGPPSTADPQAILQVFLE